MKDETKKNETLRCKHCGGPMRMYRGDINCLMCGRTVEHSCERCKHKDTVSEETLHKEVA